MNNNTKHQQLVERAKKQGYITNHFLQLKHFDTGLTVEGIFNAYHTRTANSLDIKNNNCSIQVIKDNLPQYQVITSKKILIKKPTPKDQIMNKDLFEDMFFYPNAINWMWTYCIPLGKFIDSNNQQWDLGILVNEGEWSVANVYGNDDGNYISGSCYMYTNIENETESIQEMYRRAKNLKLI